MPEVELFEVIQTADAVVTRAGQTEEQVAIIKATAEAEVIRPKEECK